MKKLFISIFFLFLIVSCKLTRSKVDIQKYYWEGKQVSKRKYDLLLYNYTIFFLNNYPNKEQIKNFLNLEVIYDTITNK